MRRSSDSEPAAGDALEFAQVRVDRRRVRRSGGRRGLRVGPGDADSADQRGRQGGQETSSDHGNLLKTKGQHARARQTRGIIRPMLLDLAHLADLVGYAAAILTTVAFFPQVLKSWQSRDLSGVSLTMYSLFAAGVALWLVYGVLLRSWPIIIANVMTLAQTGVVLTLKVRHR